MEINKWQVAELNDEQYYPLLRQILAQTQDFKFSMINSPAEVRGSSWTQQGTFKQNVELFSSQVSLGNKSQSSNTAHTSQQCTRTFNWEKEDRNKFNSRLALETWIANNLHVP